LNHFLDVLALRYAFAYNPVPAHRRFLLWLPPGGRELLNRLAQASGAAAALMGFFWCSKSINTTHTLYSRSANSKSDFIQPCITFPVGRSAYQTVSTPTCSELRIHGLAASLAAAAAGWPVIVAEGTERVNTPEPYASRGHLTPAEADALARDAGANVLVLSQLWVEGDPFRAVRVASRLFGGPVELATPGLRVGWEGS